MQHKSNQSPKIKGSKGGRPPIQLLMVMDKGPCHKSKPRKGMRTR